MRRVLAAAVALAALSLLFLAGPVRGFTLNGCTLNLTSQDANGGQLDAASGPGAGGTESDPFEVVLGGSVAYSGTTGSQIITNHHWTVSVYGLPLLSGGHPNEGKTTSAADSVAVSLPSGIPDFLKVTGLFYVSGAIDGEGGTHCDGNGWIRIGGSPYESVPFWLGVAVTVLSLGVLNWARPSRS